MDSQSRQILWANCRELRELLREIRLAKAGDRPKRETVNALVSQLEGNLKKISDHYGKDFYDNDRDA
jgi:hypothetical protein